LHRLQKIDSIPFLSNSARSAGVAIPLAANAVAEQGVRLMFAASVKNVTILAVVKGILGVYLFKFLCFGR
jgi:hypothetical protein